MSMLADNGRFYLAVYGDIKHSRLIDDRDLAQRAFLGVIDAVNADFRRDLAVPFSIAKGDEFQGLLAAPEYALAIIDAFDSRSDHFTFRYGLGWGTIETAFRSRTTEMDGTCFHNAYGALVRGKKEDRWATCSGAPDAHERVINGMLGLIQVIRDGWTARQRTAVTERRRMPTLTATSEGMGIDKSTLSKMLKAANYSQLLAAEEAMKILLRDYLVRPTGGDGT
ncbi:SatD family protein [bacterium]|nr:SatD family protein [bacterium]MBU1676306.1 SatD family protein [bacterium]